MNSKQKQNAQLALGTVVTVGGLGYYIYEISKANKRIKRMNANHENSKMLNAALDSVIDSLDKQLDNARFWDIVTRDN